MYNYLSVDRTFLWTLFPFISIANKNIWKDISIHSPDVSVHVSVRTTVLVFIWMECTSYIYISISKCVANSKNRDWLRQIFIKFLLISIMNFFHYYKMYFTLNALLQSLIHTTTTIKSNGRSVFYYLHFIKCLCNVYIVCGCGCFIKSFTDKTHINRAAHLSTCRARTLAPTIAQAIMHTHSHTHILWISRITTRIWVWWWANSQLFHASCQPIFSRFENCINQIFRHQNCKVFGSHLRLLGISFVVWCIFCHRKFNYM